MNRYPTSWLIAFFYSILLPAGICYAQNISGVVNSYYRVTAINVPTSTLTLNTTAGLTPSSKVLIIQMKGATIATSNDVSFGNITAINNAGNYEINTVCGVSGNDILLKYALLRSYTVGGIVQVVSLPVFADAIVTGTITPTPWDPVAGTGGVIAFQSNTLTLNAAIDASGAGFTGGSYPDFPDPPYDCNFATNVPDYAIPDNPPLGAIIIGGRKGEGVALGNASYALGRGKLANGGGGGNNHNSGGAGGGNYGAGGVGGQRSNEGAFNCHGQFPGIGGLALQPNGYAPAANKIFMGGGGGSGQGNNDVGMHGGIGGGIVIILTNHLFGNNNLIAANGARPFRAGLADPFSAGGDGGGGGGAGGVVILDVNNYTGNVQAQATGGRGSDASFAPSPGCFGPGGGGGGGVIWVKGAVNPLISSNVTGGANGLISMTCGVVACRGLANGAAAGSDGTTIPNYPLPVASALLCIPLPVDELISFKYKEKTSAIELNWKMSDVQQIRSFDLERSGDNNIYFSIGSINKNQNLLYSFNDVSPPVGIIYYRLKIHYLDGRVAYSEVLQVMRAGDQEFQLLNISPNPALDFTYLLMQSNKQSELSIKVYNASGQEMISVNKLLRKGTNRFPIDLRVLRAGTYYLRLSQPGKTIVKAILKSD
ncbi:MAG TPA: T9SS type A sorting domain-containing protein [Chitinophagaceae bacterium]|nr:T9SS type A sorting domain-containing protein [Chitinophagaceae bacterium]